MPTSALQHFCICNQLACFVLPLPEVFGCLVYLTIHIHLQTTTAETTVTRMAAVTLVLVPSSNATVAVASQSTGHVMETMIVGTIVMRPMPTALIKVRNNNMQYVCKAYIFCHCVCLFVYVNIYDVVSNINHTILDSLPNSSCI